MLEYELESKSAIVKMNNNFYFVIYAMSPILLFFLFGSIGLQPEEPENTTPVLCAAISPMASTRTRSVCLSLELG